MSVTLVGRAGRLCSGGTIGLSRMAVSRLSDFLHGNSKLPEKVPQETGSESPQSLKAWARKLFHCIPLVIIFTESPQVHGEVT